MIANVTYDLTPVPGNSLLVLLISSFVLALMLGVPSFLAYQMRESQAGQWLRLRAWAAEHYDRDRSEIAAMTQDQLTALPGRLLLEQQLRGLSSKGRHKAVLVLGVDGFSAINHLYGHAVGDELLRAIAVRIRASVRMANLTVRLAGDEFAVLTEIEEIGQVKSMATRLVQEMRRPFAISDKQIDVSASVGIAMESVASCQHGSLLTQASAALAEAKDLGRNRYALYDVLMGASASEIELMVGDLRRALSEREFFLLYQPKLDVQSGRLTGMEALLRWNHPLYGLVPPDQFIPLAEKTGMIVDIGRWVLHESCRQMQEWRTTQTVDWSVSVNASVFQINSSSFYSDVMEALNQYQLDAEDICIEITESGAMRNAELSLLTLRKLSAAGVRIALDDFGVGHSSLSHLKNFPVQELKIDRSFINGISECSDSEAIVRAIIGLAKAVGLQVVAEGVETEEQQELLARMDCDLIQGYLVSRPVGAEDVPALVAKYGEENDVLQRLLNS